MAINYSVLAAEIENDPQTYGYAALVASGSDEGIAALLNKPRDGSDGESAISVRNPEIAAADLLEAIDNRDWNASIPAIESGWFESITQQRTISLLNADGSNNRVLGNLRRMLKQSGDAGFQGSRTRVDALANRIGSRAEQLFGPGTMISALDVAKALGRG